MWKSKGRRQSDHAFKNLLASCLFSFFVKLCGIFVFTYEGVAWVNQADSVRDLWSNSKEISHCCPSWYEVTEFAWLQVDPHWAEKVASVCFCLTQHTDSLGPCQFFIAKWWITDQRLSLWRSPLCFQLTLPSFPLCWSLQHPILLLTTAFSFRGVI